MSEQARGIRHEAIPQWAEALVYHDDEAVYFETRGEDSSIVRFSFEMLATLKRVVEDEE